MPPERVLEVFRSAIHADRKITAEVGGHIFFESGYVGAKNVLARLQDSLHRCIDLVEAELAFADLDQLFSQGLHQLVVREARR